MGGYWVALIVEVKFWGGSVEDLSASGSDSWICTMVPTVELALVLLGGQNFVSFEYGTMGYLTFCILWMSEWSFSLMNSGISFQLIVFVFLGGLQGSFSLIFSPK
jgi:hypothetical protein